MFTYDSLMKLFNLFLSLGLSFLMFVAFVDYAAKKFREAKLSWSQHAKFFVFFYVGNVVFATVVLVIINYSVLLFCFIFVLFLLCV
jgi:Kef-type K+ transport system membrane component KefB